MNHSVFDSQKGGKAARLIRMPTKIPLTSWSDSNYLKPLFYFLLYNTKKIAPAPDRMLSRA